MESAKILAVDDRWFERGVKEAIHIRVAAPSLNKDGGRYNLPPIWNNILRARVKGAKPDSTSQKSHQRRNAICRQK